ncbi:MAG: hypothetical protein ACRBN8_18005 [Nannocystales bacterium]
MIFRQLCAASLVLSLSTPALAAEPPTPQVEASPAQTSPGRPMAVAGSVLIMASAAGYIAMAVGLGIGSNADAELGSLGSSDDIERRREVMDRGQLGNRLALGAGLASAALMATGIALVVVGRRRAQEHRATLGWLPLERGAGLQLGARF